MKKLNGESMDITAENIRAMEQLFPEAFEEGKIDFDVLRQLLGDFVDDAQERYSFKWNGKGKALRLSQTPSMGTLRPCREESKEWDNTENLYIEGDNLEVLKLLQKSYYGKVKMIYIDPPYNTGNDFVYKDNFRDNIQNYREITGQVDGVGNKNSTNTDASGRFHTDWLNMMYPRLRLARNLLSDDGVIFISIDDNEQGNLKKICDEVFGEDNSVATIHCQLSTTQGMKVKAAKEGNIVKNAEYIICYSKTGKKNVASHPLYDIRNKYDEHYTLYLKENGTIGQLKDLYDYRYPKDCTNTTPMKLSEAYEKSSEFAEIVRSHLAEIVRSDKAIGLVSCEDLECGKWKKTEHNGKEYIFTLDNKNNLKQLLRLKDSWGKTDGFYGEEGLRKIRGDWWSGFYIDMGNVSKEGDVQFKNGKKPIRLIKQIVKMVSDERDIILDFFSGSATTAHAVMQLNAEDGGKRRFIMVQLPELTDEKSDAYKAGYKNICEIGKERIRRAGDKIKAEAGDKAKDLDIGFKVFKLDSSNLQKWNPQPENIVENIQLFADNFLPDRSEHDVLYEIILKMGLDLSCPIEEVEAAGETIYIIGDGALMVCLGEDITTVVADQMVKLHQEYDSELWQVVFRDTGFASDMDKTNIKEILKSAGLAEDSFVCV